MRTKIQKCLRNLKDNKNLIEHRFVVDSILHDIKPYITELHYDKTPKILKNDHLYHLYTEIKAPLKDDSYISLIDHLHPNTVLEVAIQKNLQWILLSRKNLVREDYMVHRLAI